MTNFKTKLKNVVLKNMLPRCVQILLTHEFNISYKKLVDTGDVIKAWLDVEQKQKQNHHIMIMV